MRVQKFAAFCLQAWNHMSNKGKERIPDWYDGKIEPALTMAA